VIARQSLSHSAREVLAHEMKLAIAIASNRGRSLQNRIRFFAGHAREEMDSENQDLFVRGHFRPDLVDRFVADSGA